MKNRAIKIKGSIWKLKYLPANAIELEGAEGKCDYNSRTIYLSKTPDLDQKTLFWHEFLHAFFWECGIRDLDDNFEHVLIENLTDLLEKVAK